MKIQITLYLFTVLSMAVFAQPIIPDHWATAVYADDEWSYFVGNEAPPVDWNQPAFDDGAWLTGAGSIGYGDDDDETSITSCYSLYMRTNFIVEDTAEITSALLHLDVDDGVIVYLNGHEIKRVNISVSQPHYNTLADDELECKLYRGQQPAMFNVGLQDLADYLIEGHNILAAEVHNSSIESSDLSSSIFLTFGIADTSNVLGTPPTWFDVPTTVFTSDLPIIHFASDRNGLGEDKRDLVMMRCIDNGLGNRTHLGEVGNVYDGYVGVKVRGHASSGFDQKPYNIETRDSLGENNNVELLGMPKENDWALIGNWGDKSMLRHSLSYELSNKMGFYAPRSKHCEVYIDDQYRGVYLLSERIKRDNDRVDIAKLKENENEGDDMSGGFIFKLDYFMGDGSDSWLSTFRLPQATDDVHFVYYYPKAEDITIYQDSYIRKFINDFEKVLFGDDFADPIKGYRAYINVPSFINFLIINEVSRNLDKKSNFYHKDKDRDGIRALINAGPVWDFDWAWKYLSSAGFRDGSGWEYPRANSSISPAFPGWFTRLMEDPQFVNEFHTTYFMHRETMLNKEHIYHFMDSIAAMVDESQQRHFELYPILGKHAGAGVYNVDDVQSYQDEIVRLKTWISDRLDWLDSNMPGVMIDTSAFVPSPVTYISNYKSYYGGDHDEVSDSISVKM